MGRHRNPPETTFDRLFRQVQGYQITTPYGLVTVSEDGRRITFALWEDVRQSIHHKALFSYYQQLIRRGVNIVNVDHLDLPNLDRRQPLTRGKARIDLLYQSNGRLHEVELKTHREIGLDVTARQLEELVKHCENLIVVVPRSDVEEMRTILGLIGIEKQITVDTYELSDEDELPNDY